MKIFYYSFSLLVLFSCGNETTVTDEKTDESANVQTEADESLSESDQIIDIDESGESFFIEDMPRVWLKLTDPADIGEDGEEFLLYSYCYAEDQQIWLEPGKGEEWTLTALYGQDSGEWRIENFSATVGPQEVYEKVVEGTFDLIPTHSGIDQDMTVTFMWNQDIHFASFDKIYSSLSYFVPEDDATHYEKKSEECDYDGEP